MSVYSSGGSTGQYQKAKFGAKTQQIPADWEIGRLGDNTYIKGRIGWHGLTEDDHMEQGEYYLVTGTDFESGQVQWDRCKYVNKDWYEKDENIQLVENDILVTKDGSIGKVAFVDSPPGEATLNNGVFVLRSLNEEYVPIFFYYILKSSYFEDFIESITAGSTISHLYQKDFVNFRFPLPAPAEQHRIAEILSTVDELIQQTDDIIEEAEGLRAGLMQNLYTSGIENDTFSTHRVGPRKIEIPTNWEFRIIDELKSPTTSKKPIRGGPPGGRIKKSDRSEDGAKLYIQENVIHNDFERRGDYLSTDKFEELQSAEVDPGDVLITRSGTIGKSEVFPPDAQRGILGSSLIRIKVNEDIIRPYYLSQFLSNSHTAQSQIKAMSHGGTRTGLNNKIVKSIQIPVPPITEQDRISEILRTVDERVQQEKQYRENLEDLKQGLMQDLLTGQVRVPVET